MGRGAVLPGARTIEELWPVLNSGLDQTSEVPIERWDPSLAYRPGATELWQVSTNVGGFVTNFEYDWKRHRVPPKQIASADPLQFMLLDAADQAFRDAGYATKSFDKKRTGVVAGTIFCGEFTDQLQTGLHLPQFRRHLEHALAQRGVPQDAIENVMQAYEKILLERHPALIDETGSFTASTLASRITKSFDLMGGAVAVDSGDASSAAALHCSIDILRAGDCDMVLCAGGHRAMGIASYESLARTGLLADGVPQGPFSQDSDGCVPGEGAAVVLLKRLSDAQRDGDTIHGIIRGIGVARDESLAIGLESSVQRAHQDAGFDGTQVSIVEAASTGVTQSDRDELTALRSSYDKPSRVEKLNVGTVAGQFGNLGGAHTSVALLKASGELNHAQMPGHVGTNHPVDELASNECALQLAISPSRLFAPRDNTTLWAGVNAYSQTNVAYHILLEGMKAAASRRIIVKDDGAAEPIAPHTDDRIVRIGAGNSATLIQSVIQVADDSENAYQSSDSRPFARGDSCRLAIVAESASDLADKCRLAAQYLGNRAAHPVLASKGIFYREVTGGRLAFLFPGPDSHYDGMLRELVRTFPPAAASMQTVDDILATLSLPNFAQLAIDSDQTSRNGDSLKRLHSHSLVTNVAANYIMQQAVSSMGIRPDWVAGYGFGELSALVAARSISLDGAVRLAKNFDIAVNSFPNATGSRLRTAASTAIIDEIVEGFANEITITESSARGHTSVVGNDAAIRLLFDRLASRQQLCPKPAATLAFHTPLVRPLLDRFHEAVSAVAIVPPAVPFLRTSTARFVAEPEDIAEQFVTQLAEPIDYGSALDRLAENGTTVFVEVGPNSLLTQMHNHHFIDVDVAAINCDHPKRVGLKQLLYARACVEATGVLDRDRRLQVVQFRRSAVLQASDSWNEGTNSDSVMPSNIQSDSGVHADLSLIRLAGNPFEVGAAHGRAYADLIGKLVSEHEANTTHSPLAKPLLDEAIAKPEVFLGAEGTDELRGLSEEAGVPLETLIALQLRFGLDSQTRGLHFAVTAETNHHADGLLHCARVDSALVQSGGKRLAGCLQLRIPQ